MSYQTTRYGDIEVCHAPELDGAGSYLWKLYLPVVREVFGKVERIHEFGAGPGFIGFSLLAHGLCDSLCLSDVNPAAVAALRETARRNNLEDRVSIYESDVLDGIPEHERWDLVVANPPHYRVESEEAYRENIVGHDPQWRIHKRFYETVCPFLKPSGSTLFLENYDGNEPADFFPFLEGSGLDYLGSFMFRGGSTFFGVDRFYYFWTRRSPSSLADPPFAWEAENPVETIPLRASALSSEEDALELEAGRRYRLELENDTDSPLAFGLLVHKSIYVWPFPFPLTVPAGERRRSGAFTLDPGSYQLVHIDPRYHTRDILWRYKEPFDARPLATVRAASPPS